MKSIANGLDMHIRVGFVDERDIFAKVNSVNISLKKFGLPPPDFPELGEDRNRRAQHAYFAEIGQYLQDGHFEEAKSAANRFADKMNEDEI